MRITRPAGGETIYQVTSGVILDSETTDPVGEGLDLTWWVTYPYDPVLGTGGTTEMISPVPLFPFGDRWRPVDTMDTETWCGLDGRPIRLDLEVRDARGRTASDQVLLATYPCPVVD